MTAATVRAADWGWRHAARTDWALRGVDLDIAAGERVLLLGASGSGKSTLLAGLAGVLGGDEEGAGEGALHVNGRPAEAGRGHVGLLLQDPESQIVLSRIGDDVAFGCENLGVEREEIWRRVPEALERVGLQGLPLGHPSARLSGGQKQRLALAGVLAMRPGLLLLDEPTANLDPEGVRQVRETVAEVVERGDATLVVVEHRTAIWQDLVDRVVVLGGASGVLADGAPQRVLADRSESLWRAGVWIPGRRPLAPRPAPAPHDAPLLEAERLVAARPGAPAPSGPVDLTVHGREAIALTGPNGAGKTTLALTLGGLLEPRDGTLRAGERLAGPAGTTPHRWRSRQLVERIGSVFQTPEHQFVAATVRDELAVGPRALGLTHAEVDARVTELLDRLRLAGLADANPFTLSGGQKRRLSVATALATRPPVLVVDEPTFGQDAVTWRELVELLRRLVDDGGALVTVTHDTEVAAALDAREIAVRPEPAEAVP